MVSPPGPISGANHRPTVTPARYGEDDPDLGWFHAFKKESLP